MLLNAFGQVLGNTIVDAVRSTEHAKFEDAVVNNSPYRNQPGISLAENVQRGGIDLTRPPEPQKSLEEIRNTPVSKRSQEDWIRLADAETSGMRANSFTGESVDVALLDEAALQARMAQTGRAAVSASKGAVLAEGVVLGLAIGSGVTGPTAAIANAGNNRENYVETIEYGDGESFGVWTDRPLTQQQRLDHIRDAVSTQHRRAIAEANALGITTPASAEAREYFELLNLIENPVNTFGYDLAFEDYRANGGILDKGQWQAQQGGLITPSSDTDIVRPTFSTTDAVSISGSRAIDLGQSYEIGVRRLYGDVPFSQRQYEALVNGEWISGVADNVVTIDGKNVAVEAKFVEDWSASIRNPASKNGTRPWALTEQQTVIYQAMKYNAAFDNVIYHTNSTELATHYSRAFSDAGVNNFKFVITPAIKR